MDIDEQIAQRARAMAESMSARRRDLHRHPEAGWMEFRTASMVVGMLRDMGYEVSYGREVIAAEQRMGVPAEAMMEANRQRALAEGADPEIAEAMRGGYTGVVGVMHFAAPGPVVALRFDMDCVEVTEAADAKHRPWCEGFASVHAGCMHACGHDGHTAAGLAAAQILAELKEELAGTVKFIFQPAEEGVRGARAMAAKGIVDDVDYLLAAHLTPPALGYLAYDVKGFFATSKFDAVFRGSPTHAGATPEQGKNSLLAAATAVLNLQAIARHSAGSSRINVGVLRAGSGRNVVPAEAVLQIETRGATSEINQYMYERAMTILTSAAAMYENEVQILDAGSAAGGHNSDRLSAYVGKVARGLGIFTQYETVHEPGGSEDCSCFMERVQAHGGQAAYLVLGAGTAAKNHNLYFDFDERVLPMEVQLLATAVSHLLLQLG